MNFTAHRERLSNNESNKRNYPVNLSFPKDFDKLSVTQINRIPGIPDWHTGMVNH